MATYLQIMLKLSSSLMMARILPHWTEVAVLISNAEKAATIEESDGRTSLKSHLKTGVRGDSSPLSSSRLTSNDSFRTADDSSLSRCWPRIDSVAIPAAFANLSLSAKDAAILLSLSSARSGIFHGLKAPRTSSPAVGICKFGSLAEGDIDFSDAHEKNLSLEPALGDTSSPGECG